MNRRTLKRIALAAVPAMLVAVLVATPAQADPVLPGITNGDFSSYSGVTPGTGGDSFTNVNPTNWSGGSGLIFVTNYAGINNPNLYLNVWGPDQTNPASLSNPFPNSPLGGNFVEADGNPSFESSFSYQLSGLTVGQTYQLSFFQAAGEQFGWFSGPNGTTNQWIVGLGVPGSTFSGANEPLPTYSDPNGSVAATDLMNVPPEGVHPWEEVTVFLTADAANDVLTFLAWANGGSTINVPPIAFLDIANDGNLVSSTPEPASLTLVLTGLFGIGAYKLRRRRANSATV